MLNPCTVTAGPHPCFQVAYAQGNQPLRDDGWGLEIALDVQSSHAIASGADILLVEASDAYFSSMLAAVDIAVNTGARVVSMSWGSGEWSTQSYYDPHFNVLAYDGFLLRIADLTEGHTLRSVLAEAFEEEMTTGDLQHYPKHLPRSGSRAYFQDMSAWAGDSQGLKHVHMKLPGMAGSTAQLRFGPLGLDVVERRNQHWRVETGLVRKLHCLRQIALDVGGKHVRALSHRPRDGFATGFGRDEDGFFHVGPLQMPRDQT